MVSKQFFLILALLFQSLTAHAVSELLPFQARITDLGGVPYNIPVNIRFRFYGAGAGCYIYEETQIGVMPNTYGVISVILGAAGNKTFGVPQFRDIFDNTSAGFTDSCAGTYVPASNDYREIELVIDDGGGYVAMAPKQTIAATPFSLQARNAVLLGGRPLTGFIQTNGTLTQANAQSLVDGSDASALHNHNSLYARIDGTNTFTGNIQTAANIYTTLGSIGIGTTSTAADLEISKSAPTFRLTATGVGNTSKIDFYGTGGTQRASIRSSENTSELRFYTGSTEALRLDSAQNAYFSSNVNIAGILSVGKYTTAQETGTLQPTLAGQGAAAIGAMWANTNGTTGTVRYWDGSQMQTVANTSNTISNTLSSGQILVGNGTNVAAAVTMSGDATISNLGVLTLANTGVGAGTYKSVTVDTKGRITGGTNPTTLAGFGITDAVQNDGGVPGIQSNVIGSRPAVSSTGSLFVDTTNKRVQRWNGASWETIAVSSATDLTGTANSALYVSSTGSVTSAPMGIGQILVGTALAPNVVSVSGDATLSAAGVLSVNQGTYAQKGIFQGLTDAATSGLGISAGTIWVNAGTLANNIVKLDSSARIPAVDGSLITGLTIAQLNGTLPISKGGTGRSTAVPAGGLLMSDGANYIDGTIAAGSGVTITNVAGVYTISAVGLGGTVTNVVPGSGISSNPAAGITTAGTLSVNVDNSTIEVNANALRVRDGGITAAKLESATNGQLLIGNGTGFTKSTLTAGTGLNITNAAGSITIAGTNASYSAKGVVQLDTNAATSGLTVSAGTIAVNYGTLANQIVKLDGSSRLPAVDGSLLTGLTMAQVTGTVPISKGGTGRATVVNAGNFLISDGTGYVEGTLVAGAGAALTNIGGVYTLTATGSGGTVTQVYPGIGINMNPAGGITTVGTINVDVATATTRGVMAAGYGMAVTNGTVSVTGFSGTLAGDVIGQQGTTSVIKIQGRNVSAATPAAGNYLIWNGAQWEPSALAGSISTMVSTANSVLSVGATGFVTPVPLTSGQILVGTATSPNAVGISGDATLSSLGTLTVSTGTVANSILRLDSSGRIPALDASQVTNINFSQLAGTASVAQGGVGRTSIANTGNFLISNGASYINGTIAAGSGASLTNVNGTITISATGLGGTVTNVVPGLGLSSNPGAGITQAGTLTVNVDNSTVEINANAIRVKDAGITAAKLESATNGQLFIGNGTGFTKATLTPGTGVHVTNAAGAITLAGTNATYAAKGLVQIDTNVATSGINVSAGTISIDYGTGANQIVRLDGSSRIPAVDGSLITNLNGSNFSSGTLAIARGGTGRATVAGAGKFLMSDGSNYIDGTIATGSGASLTNVNGTITISATGLGGTVTNVGLSVPSFLSVSVGSISTAGTFAVSLVNQSANTFLAGPASGAAATPTFRTMAFGDIASLGVTNANRVVISNGTGTNLSELTLTSGQVLIGNASGVPTAVSISGDATLSSLGTLSVNASNISLGTLSIARGGTGRATATATGNFLMSNGTGYVDGTIAAGSGVSLTNSGGTISISATGLGGTVTDVRSGNGVTTNPAGGIIGAGTVSVNVDNSTVEINANAIRVKDAGITAAKLESATNGQLFIGNGTGFTKSTLTPGAGMDITNASGAITIAGTNASYTARGIVQLDTNLATSGINVSAGTISINTGTGPNQIVKLDGTSRIPALDGSLLTNLWTTQLSGTLPISKGGTGRTTVSSVGNFLMSDGTGYINGTIAAGSGVSLTNSGGTISISATGLGGTVTDVRGGNGVTTNPAGGIIGAGSVSVNVDNSTVEINANAIRVKDAGITAAKLESATNGQLFIGNGTGFTKATLTEGAGLNITNASGSITIAGSNAAYAGKGVVQLLTDAATSGINVSAGTISINTGTGPNQIVKLDVSSRIPAVDGSLLTNLWTTQLSGTLPISKGGTGRTTAAATGNFLMSNGTGYVDGTIAAGAGVVVTNVNGTLTIGTSGGGTVTDVRAGNGVTTNPAGGITGAGTVSVNVDNSTVEFNANAIRVKDAGITAAKLESATNGQLFIGNGTGFTKSTLTPGAGMNISNSAGAITIAGTTASYAAKGMVQILTDAATSGINVSAGTISVNYGTGPNQIVKLDVSSRIPALDGSLITNLWTSQLNGTVSNANGGLGRSTIVSTGNFPVSNGTSYIDGTISAGSGVTVTNAGGTISISATGTGGTVTNIQAGSGLVATPLAGITTIGTLAVNTDNSTLEINANAVRIKDAGVTASKLESATNGQLLIGNGTGFTKATLTSGVGLNVTNAAGSITINGTTASYAAKGMVQLLTDAATSGLNVSAGTISVNTGTGPNQIVKLDVSSRIPALDGSLLTNLWTTQLNGTLPISKGGMGRTTVVNAGNFVISNGTGYTEGTLVAGAGAAITNVNGTLTITATGLGGTVTNVYAGNGLVSNPAGGISVVGTLSANTDNTTLEVNANQVRIKDAGVTAAKLETASNGQLFIGNGTGFTKAALTEGTGLSITNGSGSITLAGTNASYAAKGIVQLLTDAATSGINVAAGTISVNYGTGPDQIVKLDNSSRIPALDGSLITNLWTAQISGTMPISKGGTGRTTIVSAGNFPVSNGTSYLDGTIAAGSGVTVSNAGGVYTINATGSGGTVTNVGLSAPSIFTVTNSPVSTAGTIDLALANQNANLIFAGPTNGAAAAPTFRSPVLADLPGAVSNANRVVVTNGTGTGLTEVALTSGQVMVGSATGVPTAVAITGDATLSDLGTLTLANSGVVAGTYPKLTVDAKGRATVGAALAVGDIPSLSSLYLPLTGGTISGNVVMGTTNLLVGVKNVPVAAAVPAGGEDGKTLRWNDTVKDWEWFTPQVAGAGISTINGLSAGAQLLANGTTGTAVTFGTSGGNTHTLHIPYAGSAGVTQGHITKTDYDNFAAKLSAITNVATLADGRIWVGDGTNLSQARIMAGDATMTNLGTITVSKIQGQIVSATAPGASGKYLTWNGTQWEAQTPAFNGTVTNIIPGNGITTNPVAGISTIGTLSVNVDNSTVEINANALRLKDGGITAAKLESASNGQLFIGNGTGFTKATLTAGTGLNITNASGSITIAGSNAAYAGKGVVQLLTDAATSGLNVAAGTISVNYGTGPDQIVKLDGSSRLPAVDASALTNLYMGNVASGTLAIARGGTGRTTVTSAGNFLMSNGTGYIDGTIAAGTGVTLSNAAGVYTINATGSGGTVTNVGMSVPSFLSVTGGSISTAGTFAISLANQNANLFMAGPSSGGATTPTFRTMAFGDIASLGVSTANRIVVTNSAGNNLSEIALTAGQILVGDAANAPSAVTVTGDATLSALGTLTVTKIQGQRVSASAPGSSGQLLTWNGSQWEAQNVAAPVTNIVGAGGVVTTPAAGITNGIGTLSVNASNISAGTLAIARGGTGRTTVTPVGNFLVSDGTNYIDGTIAAGSGVSLSNVAGVYTITATGSGGTVTNVFPGSGLSSNPGAGITGAGTLTVNVDNSTVEINANALRLKDGGITAAKLESASNGQLFIGNGTGFTKATLTAGTGLNITNASGSITIAGSNAAYAGKGIVQLLTDAATSGLNVAAGTISVNYGTGPDQIVKLDGSSRLPAVDASALTNLYMGNVASGTLAIARGGTGRATVTPVGNFLTSDGTNYIDGTIAAGSGVTVSNAGGVYTINATGSGGTVTNVGMSVPSFLNVTGGSISTAGTFAISLANQNANLFMAGPSSGGAATPTFRTMAFADIASLGVSTANRIVVTNGAGNNLSEIALTAGQVVVGNAGGAPTAVTISGDGTLNSAGTLFINASNISNGTLSVARGGTGRVTATSAGNFLMSDGSVYSDGTIAAGTGVTVSNAGGVFTINATGLGGTVTNILPGIGINMNPAGGITGAGTINVDVATATVRGIMAAGSGLTPTNGTVTVNTDNSTVELNAGAIRLKDGGITAAKLESASNGQLFIGNGTGFTKAALTAGTGLNITNASGSITIAGSNAAYAGKGIVQLDTDAATSGLTVAAGTIAVNYGTGVNQIVKLDGSSRIPAVDGSLLTNLWTTQLSGTLPISKGGTGRTTVTPVGNFLISDGTNYVSGTIAAGTGVSLSNVGGVYTINATGTGGTVTNVYAGLGLVSTPAANISTIGTLTVNTDNSTIEINTNALRLKDGGITAAKLESASNGQLFIGNGTGFTKAALTAGTGLNITNASGSITIAGSNAAYAGKGIVQLDTDAATSGLTVAAGTIAVNYGTGVNQIVKLDGSSRIPAVDGSLLTNLWTTQLSGTLPISKGGTGRTTVTPVGNFLISDGTNYVSGTIAAGTGVSLSNVGGVYTINATGTGGTVTNVFSGSGVTTTPVAGITTIGTVAVNTDNSTVEINTNALRLKDGGITAAKLESASNGQLFIGNGTGFTKATLSAGTGLNITNASGSITIAGSNAAYAGKGIVQLDTDAATSGLTVAAGTIAVNYGTGVNQIVRLDGSSRIPAVDGSLLTNLWTTQLSGTLPISKGGTGRTTVTPNGNFLVSDGTNYVSGTIVAGAGASVSNVAGVYTVSATGSGGTVTNVVPGSGLTSNPGAGITGAGTLTVNTDNSTIEINTNALRLKDGGITAAKLESATNGQLFIGNGTGFTKATLTAGAGFNITNASGSITIAGSNAAYAGKGIVQLDTDAATSGLTVAAGTIAVNYGTGANQLVKLDSSSRIPAVDGSLLTNLSTAQISGTLAINKGGTGRTTIASAGKFLMSDGSAYIDGTIAAGTNITVSNAAGVYTISGSGGSVTNVGLSMPSIFSVSTGSISTAGTFAVTLGTTAMNRIFAGPTAGAAAAPTLRAMVLADLPGNAITNANRVVVTNGTGTGLTEVALTSGQIMVGSATGVPTAVSVSGAATLSALGTLTVNATNIDAGTLGVAYGGTGIGTIPTAGQLLVGTGAAYSVSTMMGDGLMSSLGSLTVTGLQGRAVASTAPTGGQFLRWNAQASQWTPAAAESQIRKAANETVNNSTVLQNDDDCSFTVEPNSNYSFDLQLGLTAAAVGTNLKLTWSLPAGATQDLAGGMTTVAGFNTSTTTLTIAGVTAATHSVIVSGNIYVGATGGTAVLQWAQDTAGASNTTLLAGSICTIRAR